MAPKKPKKSATEREGVNFVCSVVEHANCIFQEIERHNDFGNDAILELVEDENVRGICLALQIKSGKSYCTTDSCTIPSDRDHFEYWYKHTLPVIGIVYDPSEERAYWTNITSYLRSRRHQVQDGPYTLHYPKTEINRFSNDGFSTFFLPQFLNKPVRLPREQAIRFANSDSPELQRLGLGALLTGYRDDMETWDLLLSLFRWRKQEEIDPYLIYVLSLVPGHMDIFWHSGSTLDESLRRRLYPRYAELGYEDVLKLLMFVGEEGFQRGSLGQGVDTIVSLVANKISILADIAESADLDVDTRMSALILLTHYSSEAADALLQRMSTSSSELSEIASQLKEEIQTYGFVYLY